MLGRIMRPYWLGEILYALFIYTLGFLSALYLCWVVSAS